MRSVLLLAVAAASGALAAGAACGEQFDRCTPIVKAVQKTRDSIVTVKVEKKGNGGRNKGSVGTGVIVDDRGYVVTNRHVVAGTANVRALLSDGTELHAQVLAEDAGSDLAILRVHSSRPLPALPLGPGTDLLVGETVIAVGHPYGYTNTVSTGIVSAVGRQITMPTGEVLRDLIQTNASINPGNSGGPLLNINGELIGINTALREGAQGIAFAVNVETVKQALSRHLSSLRVAGVRHGLHCTEEVVPDGMPRQRVRVTRVGEQSPAAAAGFLPGDEIVRVAEWSVANRFDLERALWDRKPGEQVTLTIVRDGKEMTLDLTLAQGRVGRPAGAAKNATAGVPGSTAPVARR